MHLDLLIWEGTPRDGYLNENIGRLKLTLLPTLSKLIVDSPTVENENSVSFACIAPYCEITLPPRAHGLDLHDTKAVTLVPCATDTRYIF